MSKEKRRVPKLRFPGFTEDWEQRKLGDIATLSKGNGYSKSDLSASGNPIILYGRLYTNYETTIRNVDTFVKLKDKSVISQGGEVIVPASGETAEDISRASVVKNQGVIIGGDLNVIKVNILLDPTFLALTISNGEQQKELSKRAQGKSVVHLHNSDLQEVNLIFPLLNEQRKISTLFEKMDNIITLHQRKLNNLKLKKKALLQKLFPKNGERYPELRFPGFTDAWEQRKLDELTIFIGDGLHGTPKYDENGSYYFINGNNLVDNKVSVTEETKKVAFEALGNDDRRLDSTAILMSINGTIGTLARYNNENIMLGKSVAYITPKNINRDFLFYQLQGNVIQSYFYKNLTGTTIKNLGLGTIKNTIVMSTLSEEESTIGRFFYKLDQYITLHQRKLDHLQLQKKALLQQMFV